MCTVLLRYSPAGRWPLLLAAVRDEFVDRAWDPPDAHWPSSPQLVGGRDRAAGGTWLAVSPAGPAVAALLNGVRLPERPGVSRPSRGGLPLAALTGTARLDDEFLANYDGFHLVLGTPDGVTVWSWDGTATKRHDLSPGDHIIVNDGVNATQDPLVPHFMPLLRATPPPPLDGTAETKPAWAGWVELLRGDELPADDPRALIMRREFGPRTYGSTSVSLIALRPDGVRFDFSATPANPAWSRIRV